MVTAVPTGPVDGDMPVTVGTAPTVNSMLLLARPPTVIAIEPAVAPAGTGTTMLVLLQLLGEATTPLKLTILLPCVVPKFVPVIVTDVPTGPCAGVRVVMLGAAPTPKLTPLLATPATLTTTGPVDAPAGTGTRMLVLLQTLGVPLTPLKVTVLLPCVAPKLNPLMLIAVPMAAAGNDRFVI